MSDFQDICTIESRNVPCSLISGSDDWKIKLLPTALDSEATFTLTLPKGFTVHPGDKVTHNDQEYLVRVTMKSDDSTELYWAILTK